MKESLSPTHSGRQRRAGGSLATRLILVNGLLSAAVVAIMGVGIFYLTTRYLQAQAEGELAALTRFYAAFVGTTAPDEDRLTALAPQIAGFFATQSDYDVRVFNWQSGALMAATRDIGPLPSSVALAELGQRRPTFFLSASADQPNRLYAARPVTSPDGNELAVIEISRDTTEVQTFLRVLSLVVAIAGGLALTAALVASLLLARQMTRPLREMEQVTKTIANGDFDKRLVVTSKDEIGRLAASINLMATDLGRLEASRREFIAKISHDLRTPLSAIKGMVINLLDSAPDDMQVALATIDEQADRLIRLVNDLLALSRLQRGELRLRRTVTDLMKIARSAQAVVADKARRQGVALSLHLPPQNPPIQADADRLQQVVVNLLDNAIRVTPAGGSVQLAVFAAESEVTLIISDQGPGPTEEEVIRAFEPYFSRSGGGAGLGLTIAREIVNAHGGRIWLASRPGGGAEAGFSLPVS